MSIKSIYLNLDESLGKIISESKSLKVHDSAHIVESAGLLSADGDRDYFSTNLVSTESRCTTEDRKNYGVKEIVRHKFGKNGTLLPSFGCHPDFEKMKEGELRNGYTITLFMDIIGSTKLGVIFSPDVVFKIKNNIIKCAIETVNSFDGHVHRIMGDAVMAFFRNKKYQEENRMADSAIDAINCATFLIEMFENVVALRLDELGIDENLGIRIGIDYGADRDVIWGKYGYMESQEVTATSFFVDVAAKLQQKAPKNSIMIGDSLARLIGFDDNQLIIKEKIKDGNVFPVKYVMPNYKDSSGKTIDYKQYILRNKLYYEYLPINDSYNNLSVRASLKKNKDEVSNNEYYPCSRFIKKGMGISFKGYYNSDTNYDDPKFKFRVVNTGKEAAENKNYGNHEEFENAKQNSQGRYFAKHWEDTSYKGLHHMYVSFWDGNVLIAEEVCFSIFVND